MILWLLLSQFHVSSGTTHVIKRPNIKTNFPLVSLFLQLWPHTYAHILYERGLKTKWPCATRQPVYYVCCLCAVRAVTCSKAHLFCVHGTFLISPESNTAKQKVKEKFHFLRKYCSIIWDINFKHGPNYTAAPNDIQSGLIFFASIVSITTLWWLFILVWLQTNWLIQIVKSPPLTFSSKLHFLLHDRRNRNRNTNH